MSREIKFRIWDKKYQQFVTSSKPFDTELNDIFKDFGINVFQQYTGFKDKNGKEIYEGDIIRIRCYEDWGDTEGTLVDYVIFWSTYELGWRGFTQSMNPKKHAGIKFHLLEQHPELLVVGHIFQNPLLWQIFLQPSPI